MKLDWELAPALGSGASTARARPSTSGRRRNLAFSGKPSERILEVFNTNGSLPRPDGSIQGLRRIFILAVNNHLPGVREGGSPSYAKLEIDRGEVRNERRIGDASLGGLRARSRESSGAVLREKGGDAFVGNSIP